MQAQTKNEIFAVLEKYHQILQIENMKAALDKSHFLNTRNPIEITHRCNPKNSATYKKSKNSLEC